MKKNNLNINNVKTNSTNSNYNLNKQGTILERQNTFYGNNNTNSSNSSGNNKVLERQNAFKENSGNNRKGISRKNANALNNKPKKRSFWNILTGKKANQ